MDWVIHTTKLKKLDSLERKLRGMKASEVVEHQQLGRVVSSFMFGLEETRENLELEVTSVLRRIGVNKSSSGVATVASMNVALDGGLQLASDDSECSL